MKPRVYFKDGWWRVSKMPKPYHRNMKLWGEVHRYAGKLNEERCRGS
jgi:hypothetical protein